jgi:hypothetical protein
MDSRELAETYAQMSDDELLDLGAEYDQLTEVAQQALRAEFSSRKLETPKIAEPENETAPVDAAVLSDLVDPACVRQVFPIEEAVLAHQRLLDAGIPAHLQPTRIVRSSRWAEPTSFQVMVSATDFSRANEFLNVKEREQLHMPEDADYEGPTCPKCRSSDIAMQAEEPVQEEEPIETLPPKIPNPTEQELLTKTDWKCLACGHGWQEQD